MEKIDIGRLELAHDGRTRQLITLIAIEDLEVSVGQHMLQGLKEESGALGIQNHARHNAVSRLIQNAHEKQKAPMHRTRDYIGPPHLFRAVNHKIRSKGYVRCGRLVCGPEATPILILRRP